jgi:ketosteroid isomerase-like protein
MTALAESVETLADTFFGALEAGSVEGVLACYAPDAKIWHNFDRLALTPQESVAGLQTLFTNFASRRYLDVRRQPTPGGFVQQHVLRLEQADGTAVDWPGCIVCDVADGKITRLDEYVDLAQLTTGG